MEKVRARIGSWLPVLVLTAVAFATGLGFSSFIHRVNPNSLERGTVELSRLTSPFLECSGELNGDAKLVRARRSVVSLVREAQQADPSLRVSVYARDLNNGPWIGVDERELFVPASLNKVPVLIYVLARAESDPSSLDQLLTYPGPEAMESESSLGEEMADHRMEAGAEYSIRDLLFRMIGFSDNHAKELLMGGVSEADVEALMQIVHAGNTTVDGRLLTDAKTYASIFRVLYNANFLDRGMSEYALDLLTRSHFQEGIRRYIPEEIPIASKFGFSEDPSGRPRAARVHECGIIYQPDAPYVLCVMTRSEQASEAEMAEVMAQVSRTIWTIKTE